MSGSTPAPDRKQRELTAGPANGPQPPFPLKLSGKVIKGFGRGSKELGIPTANIPLSGLTVGGKELESGVYYGWAGLDFHSPPSNAPHKAKGAAAHLKHASETIFNAVGGAIWGSEDDDAEEGWDGQGRVHPMVMSVGWNPYYKNEVRSVEIHIMHHFTHDFYGSHMNLLVLGFIRPELDYVSKEALIADIKTDIEVAGRSLGRPAYGKYRKDKSLLDFPEAHSKEEQEKIDTAA